MGSFVRFVGLLYLLYLRADYVNTAAKQLEGGDQRYLSRVVICVIALVDAGRVHDPVRTIRRPHVIKSLWEFSCIRTTVSFLTFFSIALLNCRGIPS